ncbi:hypothetical protein TOL_1281 [Thalassolituus oleivorans MIL-1]|uniref:DNA-binding protein n=1 Tax=Thalassolituus oleivorans MIL-1 TaxID=1298593 RepID=M5E2A0_9GAMM|nr:hypothetical protein TOL_1281 [Thalassolituus oleivorans MIL-1]
MDAIERIDLLARIEGLSRPELARKCGLKEDRIKNVMTRRAKLYQDDMEALFAVWPEYAHWLATGLELAEAGQISPMTKKLMKS